MKKLVVISATLAVVAVALYSLRPQPVADPPPAPAPANTRTLQTSASDQQPPEDMSTPPPVKTPSLASPAQRAPTSETRPQPTANAQPEDERKQLAACRVMWDRKRKREQAAHDAETKDQAWAYPMEQKLREYLTRGFQTIPVEVTLVDCKTTFCDIRAQGFSKENSAEFNRVVEKIRDESWNVFSGMSMSLEEEGDKFIYIAEVRLQQSYENAGERPEEQAQNDDCMRLSGRQAQRQRAVHDSESKDTSWSGPMEQLLRDHIVRQMAKHPIEALEVDCRTSFCRVKAKGAVQDSLLALQKVIYEMASEPWANLRSGEAGSSGYGDRWTADFMLYRQ